MPKGYEVNLPGCFIAGGAVLSRATKTETNDYDVYPKTDKAMIDAFYTLIEEDGCFVVNISDRAVTFKSNDITNDKGERGIIQVMTYDTFETAEKIFEHFDFTVCMGAFDCDTKEHTFHPDFYPDIASKTIRFNPNTRYPLNSLLRLTKYTAKGYHIGKPEHIRMILTAIDKGLPTSWQELESQIGGTYGREISLRVEDEQFTLERALEVLADIESFTYYERDKEITEEMSTGEYLEDLFSRDLKTVVVNADGEYFLVDTETMVATRFLGEAKPKNYTLLNENDPEFRLYGYKVLKDNGNGTYGPGLYNTYGKKVVYVPGQETEELNSPYLFVFKDLKQARSRVGASRDVFKVSYRAGDLKMINKSGEIQVTRMRIDERVSDE
jgi:hypothetical protein